MGACSLNENFAACLTYSSHYYLQRFFSFSYDSRLCLSFLVYFLLFLLCIFWMFKIKDYDNWLEIPKVQWKILFCNKRATCKVYNEFCNRKRRKIMTFYLINLFLVKIVRRRSLHQYWGSLLPSVFVWSTNVFDVYTRLTITPRARKKHS